MDKKGSDFYRISELMLPTLIQRYDKIISFLTHAKNERLSEILQAVRCHMYYYVFKPFFDNKMSILEEYGTSKEEYRYYMVSISLF